MIQNPPIASAISTRCANGGEVEAEPSVQDARGHHVVRVVGVKVPDGDVDDAIDLAFDDGGGIAAPAEQFREEAVDRRIDGEAVDETDDDGVDEDVFVGLVVRLEVHLEVLFGVEEALEPVLLCVV